MNEEKNGFVSKKKYKFGTIIMLSALCVLLLSMIIATSVNVNKRDIIVKNSLGVIDWKKKTFTPNFDDQVLQSNGIVLVNKKNKPAINYQDIFSQGKSFKKFVLNSSDSYLVFSENTKNIEIQYRTKKSYNRKKKRNIKLKVKWDNVLFTKDENNEERFTILKEKVLSNREMEVFAEANAFRGLIYKETAISEADISKYDLATVGRVPIIHSRGAIGGDIKFEEEIKGNSSVNIYPKERLNSDSKVFQVRTYIQKERENILVNFEKVSKGSEYKVYSNDYKVQSWYVSNSNITAGDSKKKLIDGNSVTITGDTFIYGAVQGKFVVLKYSHLFEANNEEAYKYEGGWRNDYVSLKQQEEVLFLGENKDGSNAVIDISEAEILAADKFNDEKFELEGNKEKLLGYELAYVELNGDKIDIEKGLKFENKDDSPKEIKFFYKRKKVEIEVRDKNGNKVSGNRVGIKEEYKFTDFVRINDLVESDKKNKFASWKIVDTDINIENGILVLDEKCLVNNGKYINKIILRAQYEESNDSFNGPIIHVDYKYEEVDGSIHYCEDEKYNKRRIDRRRVHKYDQRYLVSEIYEVTPPNNEEFDISKTKVYDEREQRDLIGPDIRIDKVDYMHLTVTFMRKESKIEIVKNLPGEPYGYLDSTQFKKMFVIDENDKTIRYGSKFSENFINKFKVTGKDHQLIRQPGASTRFKGWMYEDSNGEYKHLDLESYIHKTKPGTLKLYALWEQPTINVVAEVRLQNPDGLGFGDASHGCKIENLRFRYKGDLQQELDLTVVEIQREVAAQISSYMNAWGTLFDDVFIRDTIAVVGTNPIMTHEENRVTITVNRKSVKLVVSHISFDSEKVKDPYIKDKEEFFRIERIRDDFQREVNTGRFSPLEKMGLASIGYQAIQKTEGERILYRDNRGEVKVAKSHALNEYEGMSIGDGHPYELGYFFVNGKVELGNTYILRKDKETNLEITYLYRPRRYKIEIVPDELNKMDMERYERNGKKRIQMVRHMDRVILEMPYAKREDGEIKYVFDSWEYEDGKKISNYLIDREGNNGNMSYIMPASDVKIRPKWVKKEKSVVKIEYLFEKSTGEYKKRDEVEAKKPNSSNYSKGDIFDLSERFIKIYSSSTLNTNHPYQGYEFDSETTLENSETDESGNKLIRPAANGQDYNYKVAREGVIYVKLYYRLLRGKIKFVNGYSKLGYTTEGMNDEMIVTYKKAGTLPKEGIRLKGRFPHGGTATLRGWSRIDAPDSELLDQDVVFDNISDFTKPGREITLYARWNYLTDVLVHATVEFEKPKRGSEFEWRNAELKKHMFVFGPRSAKFDDQEPIPSKMSELRRVVYGLLINKIPYQDENSIEIRGFEGADEIKFDLDWYYVCRVYRKRVEIRLENPEGRDLTEELDEYTGFHRKEKAYVLEYKYGQELHQEPKLTSTVDEEFMSWQIKDTNEEFKFYGHVVERNLVLEPKMKKHRAVINLMHGDLPSELINYVDSSSGVKVEKNKADEYTKITINVSKLPYRLKSLSIPANSLYFKSTHRPAVITGYSEPQITTEKVMTVTISATEDVNRHKDSYPQSRVTKGTYDIDTKGKKYRESINVTAQTSHELSYVYYKGEKFEKLEGVYYLYEKVTFEKINGRTNNKMTYAIDLAQFRDQFTTTALQQTYSKSYLKGFFEKYVIKKLNKSSGINIDLPKFAESEEVVYSSVFYDKWEENTDKVRTSAYAEAVRNNYYKIRKIGEYKTSRKGYIFKNTYKRNGYQHEMIIDPGQWSAIPLLDKDKTITEGYASYIRLVQYA